MLGRRFVCPIGPATQCEFILDWRISYFSPAIKNSYFLKIILTLYPFKHFAHKQTKKNKQIDKLFYYLVYNNCRTLYSHVIGLLCKATMHCNVVNLFMKEHSHFYDSINKSPSWFEKGFFAMSVHKNQFRFECGPL